MMMVHGGGVIKCNILPCSLAIQVIFGPHQPKTA